MSFLLVAHPANPCLKLQAKVEWVGSPEASLGRDVDEAANANLKPLAPHGQNVLNMTALIKRYSGSISIKRRALSKTVHIYWLKRKENKNKKEISAKKNDECEHFFDSNTKNNSHKSKS